MSCKLVVFDLDGTLLDTIDDLGEACNHVLLHYGYQQHPLEAYKLMVGNGITKLIERAMPDQHRRKEEIEQARTLFLEYYNDHIADHTHPYDGIEHLLEKLNGSKTALAVASNKFDSGTKHLIATLFGKINFAAVLGQTESRATKPDPSIVFEIMQQCNVKPCETLYVGDSGVDMATAHNAGIRSVGVTWGFRSREELTANGAWRTVDTADELGRIIDEF